MENRFLTLVRHAKSSWKEIGQTDHERTLNGRGRRDAPVMANRLIDRQCIPDLILCSSAVRTQQTASVFMDAFKLGDEALRVQRQLYLCTPETLLEQIGAVEDGPRHIMVIAHNPGLEQLSSLMSPQCNAQMPTLGIRHFACTSFERLPLGQSLQQSAQNRVELVFEDFPKSDQ